MCGRANPEDLKECQYCQARLVPMWDFASTASQSEPSEGQDDDLPEWLKSLRVPQDDQSTVTEPEPEDRSVIPDWLSDLREQPVDPGYLQSDASPTNQSESADDETADWLQRFLAPDSLAEAEEGIVAGGVSEASSKDETDWLSRIDKTPVEEERPGEPVGSIDWMTDQEPEITGAPAIRSARYLFTPGGATR